MKPTPMGVEPLPTYLERRRKGRIQPLMLSETLSLWPACRHLIETAVK